MMKKLLLTGFEVFGNYSENISELAARKIKMISGYSVESLIFPTNIFSKGAENFGEDVVRKAEEIRATAIISLGMSSRVAGVRIELKAANWVNSKYSPEEENGRVLNPQWPADRSFVMDLANIAKWNILGIWSDLTKVGLEYEKMFSGNAGNFCCNALMFRTLQAREKRGCNIPYLFLHFPCTSGALKNFPASERMALSVTSLAKVRRTLEIVMDNCSCKHAC